MYFVQVLTDARAGFIVKILETSRFICILPG